MSKELICILDVKLVRVPYDYYKFIPKGIKHPVFNLEDVQGTKCSEIFFDVEEIKGTTFVNQRGERINIGVSKDVQNTLGLAFEVFRKQEDLITEKTQRIIDLRTINSNLNQVINNFEEASLWKRIKLAFKGKLKTNRK